MTTQLSPQEWQTLSAYLDGELSPREQKQVEDRLQTRPELQAGLEEMRRTRLMLRSLPKRRAPRNFTLTAAMVQQKRPAPRAYPFLRLASAFASFLLVAAFLSDLVFGLGARNTMSFKQAAAPAAQPAYATQAAGLPAQPVAEPTQLMAKGLAASSAAEQTATPANEMESSNLTTADQTQETERNFAPAAPTPNATEEIYQRMTAAPPGMGGGTGLSEGTNSGAAGQATGSAASAAEAETPMTMLGAEQPAQPPESATSQVMLPQISAPNATANQAEPEPAPLSALQDNAAQERQPAAPVPTIRWIEGLLAAIAVITGIAALVIRWKSTL